MRIEQKNVDNQRLLGSRFTANKRPQHPIPVPSGLRGGLMTGFPRYRAQLAPETLNNRFLTRYRFASANAV